MSLAVVLLFANIPFWECDVVSVSKNTLVARAVVSGSAGL